MGGTYRLYGLTVLSDVAFPMAPAADAPEPCLVIRSGPVAPPGSAPGCSELLFALEPGLRFSVRSDGEIRVEAPERPPETLWPFLLGSPLAVALVQRGFVPFHASAVAVGGRGVVLCGRRGAGKSVLAAALRDRGCAPVADDLCAVALAPQGPPVVHPSHPFVKRRGDVFPAGHTPLLPWRGKTLFRLDEGVGDEPFELARFVRLRPVSGGRWGPLRRLAGAEKFAALAEGVYRKRLLRALGLSADVARCLTALVLRTEVYDLARPEGEVSPAEGADCVLSALDRREPGGAAG